jgi:hypothetical protein
MFAQEPPPDFDVPGRREPGERSNAHCANAGRRSRQSAILHKRDENPATLYIYKGFTPILLRAVYVWDEQLVPVDIEIFDSDHPADDE